jgi:hypothetical protein
VERIARFLEARWLWCLAAFSAIYWAATWKTAVSKPLWGDEIVTYYVASQPTWADVWRALLMRADQQTPLFYLVTRIAAAIGGPAGLRLPGMIGMWLTALCLFAFVARRAGRVAGMTAMLAPFLLGSAPYAYDARPYGLLMGSAAAMLLLWQLAADGYHRKAALPWLWAAAAFTASIHYLGGLALAPIAVGELVRWKQNRKPDWAVWLVLVFAVAPLALTLPVIRAAASAGARFWAPPRLLGSLNEFYTVMLAPAALLAAGLILIALFTGAFAPEALPLKPPCRRDVSVLGAFLSLPVLYVLAGFRLGVFVPRYAIVATLGVSAGLAFLTAGKRSVAVLTLLLTAGQFAVLEVRRLAKTETPRQLHLPEDEASRGLPVVMSGPNEFLETRYYAPPTLAARLHYISDPALALRYADTDSVDLAVRKYAIIAPLQVDSYTGFLAAHSRFLVVHRKEEVFGWILQKLHDDGATITLRNLADEESVYEVVVPSDRP